MPSKAGAGAENEVEDAAPVDDNAQRKSNLLFHMSMALGALYLSMLLTNWGSVDSNQSNTIDVGLPAFWIKIASQWVTLALYIWTLGAPSLFPDRDFS